MDLAARVLGGRDSSRTGATLGGKTYQQTNSWLLASEKRARSNWRAEADLRGRRAARGRSICKRCIRRCISPRGARNTFESAGIAARKSGAVMARAFKWI